MKSAPRTWRSSSSRESATRAPGGRDGAGARGSPPAGLVPGLPPPRGAGLGRGPPTSNPVVALRTLLRPFRGRLGRLLSGGRLRHHVDEDAVRHGRRRGRAELVGPAVVAEPLGHV